MFFLQLQGIFFHISVELFFLLPLDCAFYMQLNIAEANIFNFMLSNSFQMCMLLFINSFLIDNISTVDLKKNDFQLLAGLPTLKIDY